MRTCSSVQRTQTRDDLRARRPGLTCLVEQPCEDSRSSVELLDSIRAPTSVLEDRVFQNRWLLGSTSSKAGLLWEHNDLVFGNEIGKPMDAENMLYRYFWPSPKRAGPPRIRFHDLRHTAATLLMGQSIHPKVVSEILGHSQICITLDLYSHTLPAMHHEAAAAMDATLGG